jgi:nitrate/nitrite transporter NarK
MDAFSRTIDDMLVIETIAFVVMCVAAAMASAGIYRFIKYRKRREANDASEQQALSNAIHGRMIEFYVPDKFRTNLQGGARVRSHLSGNQRKQRG